MVCEWGMSDRIGPIAFGRPDEEVFLGREIVQNRHVSEETAELIDAEVRKIVESGKQRATDILTANRAALDSLAMALLERETLDEEAVAILISGNRLPEIPVQVVPAEVKEPAQEPSPSAGDSPAS
jgi:cell division protease FtsH